MYICMLTRSNNKRKKKKKHSCNTSISCHKRVYSIFSFAFFLIFFFIFWWKWSFLKDFAPFRSYFICIWTVCNIACWLMTGCLLEADEDDDGQRRWCVLHFNVTTPYYCNDLQLQNNLKMCCLNIWQKGETTQNLTKPLQIQFILIFDLQCFIIIIIIIHSFIHSLLTVTSISTILSIGL